MVLLPAGVLMLHGAGDGYGDSASLWLPWQDAYLRQRLLWTLGQAALSTFIVLLLGVPLAWVLARWQFAGRTLLLRSLMLPFVVPTLVAALGVLTVWGTVGDGALRDTPWLLLYGNVFFNLCLVVRAGHEGLQHVAANRVAAARTLGASPWRTFWRVEWPAMLPWLASALCLVFLYCFSGFGLALVLGGSRYATAEVEVYTLVAHELELGQASVLALWLMLCSGAVALAYAWVERWLATPVRAAAVPRQAVRGWRMRVWLLAALLIWMLFEALPLISIAVRAINLGADAWAVLWQDETLLALWNTLRFSTVAVLLATLLGLLLALAAQRWLWLRTVAYVPLIVSPVLVAFGLLLLYPQWAGELPLLLAAYTVLAVPLVAKAVAAGLDNLPPQWWQAARCLGASPWRAFWRITLPLLLPAVRRGMAMAAATAVGEFAVTLFLSRPEWMTLTTLIYSHLGRPGAAHQEAALVLSALLMLLALLAFVLTEAGRQTDSPSD
ncbi:iron ABC transporter permease [Curvibacter sp. CHRR-16]|nr:iron ABC transporter permease [Curvibacter sp. CHRR-16]